MTFIGAYLIWFILTRLSHCTVAYSPGTSNKNHALHAAVGLAEKVVFLTRIMEVLIFLVTEYKVGWEGQQEEIGKI